MVGRKKPSASQILQICRTRNVGEYRKLMSNIFLCLGVLSIGNRGFR